MIQLMASTPSQLASTASLSRDDSSLTMGRDKLPLASCGAMILKTIYASFQVVKCRLVVGFQGNRS